MSASAQKHPGQLLVEGKDDQHVVWALCERFNIPENFEVLDGQGVDNILDQISVRFKQSDVKTIGIVVDADTDLRSRWRSLAAALEKAGFQIQEELPGDGLIVDREDGKRAGVWIMPNNQAGGMLEDLVAFLVPADDGLWPIAHTTLQGIEARGIHRYIDAHRSKALLHTWLAWQPAPGTPMGLAITRRYLTTDVENCRAFVGWLSMLFAETESVS